MGYIAHHAIVVSSWMDEAVEEAHAEAVRLDMEPSPILPHKINGGGSFLCPPDGSKEGWAESYKGDARREALVRYLRGMVERERWIDWIEVRYGGDEPELAHIVTEEKPNAGQ